MFMSEEDNSDEKEDNKEQKKNKKSIKSRTREAFLADAFSILFNRNHMMLDLKQNVPSVSVDGGKHKKKTVTFHRPIVMNPVLAKKFNHILSKNIKKYEEKYGEIKVKDGSDDDTEDDEDNQDEKPDLNYIG